MALHPPPPPPPLKQPSITTPFPLPLPPSTQFSPQNNMLTFADHIGIRLSDTTYGHNANLNTMEDESGASTPPLWSPTHRQNIDYRCLSPSSKTEAIARGQRELMEMVSRMPEACYELSLRDLVEHHHHHHQPLPVETKQNKKKKKNPKVAQIKRSGSMDNGGFLLKMVFPISLRSSKKKKTKKKNDCETASHSNCKVYKKATVSDGSGSKSVDKDWWKKRSGSSESESSAGSTINSGSTKSIRSSSTSSTSSLSTTSNNSHRDKRGGCLDFILSRKPKSSR